MKLSIITINYNNCAGLQKTIDSVIAQTWRDFEWIVIDGGSTDGSKELIEKYKEHFAFWCSEPDKGIYNAMNKGIIHATSDYLQFLNSGDNLTDERVVGEFVEKEWEEDVIAGDVLFDNKIVKHHIDDKDFDFDYMYNGAFCHQATYIKRKLFAQYGMYDESLRIVSDWKFLFEVLIIHGVTYRHWERTVAIFYTNGISFSNEYRPMLLDERAKVLSQYRRITQSIEKRNKRIGELDLPIMVLLRQRALKKLKKMFGL